MAKDYSNLEKEALLKIINQLKSTKKYGLIWDTENTKEKFEEEAENALPVLKEIQQKKIQTDPSAPTHIMIEGDNFHALSILNYTHQKKIDVIYIDPPYNTGAKDWKYNNNFVDINDTYRHSNWLSMMSNRLHLAKNLLKDDGVLICAIDENEVNRLGLLLEEIFGNYDLHCVTIVHNPRGVQGQNFSYTHEYAYFVIPRGQKVIGHRRIKEEDVDWRNLRDNGGESLRADARNCFYPIIIENEEVIGFGEVVPNGEHPSRQTVQSGNQFLVYPIDRQQIERKWRYARQSVEEIKDHLRAKKTREGYEIELGKDFGTVRTVWQDSRYDANEYGTKLVNTLVPNTPFDFPKSIYNTYDCIAPILYERKNAIILDFFAGSGTTGHAVSLLNKEDNGIGNRQCILVTNNENGIARDVCFPRIKAVIEGNPDYADITGIPSNLRYFETAFIKKSINRDALKIGITNKCTEMLCLREGVFDEKKATNDYRLFHNNDQVLAIFYSLETTSLTQLKADLASIEGNKILYCFTLDPLGLTQSDFGDWTNVRLEPIPQKILEIYEQIYEY